MTAAEIAMLYVGTDKATDLELAILRHMEEHIAAEREACAQLAEGFITKERAHSDRQLYGHETGLAIARAIRMRGK